MSRRRFWDRIQSGEVLVSDGAMGSELIRRGVSPAHVLRANIVQEALVRDIHDEYIAAGAQILTSNTFGLRTGRDWAKELCAGIHIAVQAARENAGEIGVWLSLPGCLVSQEQEALRRLSGTVPMWPEMLLVETCLSLDEARVAARGGTALKGQLLGISAHFRADGNMPDGTTPEDFARAVVCDGAHIVGANCGVFPEQFVEITARMRAATHVPLLVQPSAGLPQQDDAGRWNYPVAPQQFGNVAAQLFAAGANIVGGCCGASHAHIAALSTLTGNPGPRA